MLKRILIYCLMLYPVISHAQQARDTVRSGGYEKTHVPVIIAGYGYYKHHSGELGIGKFTLIDIPGPHPFAVTKFVSLEMSEFDRKALWVPKIGIYATSMGSMGASLVYYIHPYSSSLKLRTEIGMGAMMMHMFYARMFSVTNSEFWPTSKNMVGLRFGIPTRRFW